MILPMSKYSFLIFHQEYDSFLLELQRLGVVHIAERKNPSQAEELRLVQGRRVQIQELIRQLPLQESQGEHNAITISSETEGEHIEQAILQTLQARQALRDQQTTLIQTLQAQEPWGDFSLDDIERLRAAGYELRLYTTSSQIYTDAYAKAQSAIAITHRGTTQYFATLTSLDAPLCPNAERFALPDLSISQLREQLAHNKADLSTLERHIAEATPQWVAQLIGYDKLLASKYNLGAARLQAQAEADSTLMFLEGWIPTEDAPALEAELTKTGYYYQASPIEDEDKVPIKLKNNYFSRLFEPITGMFSLPNYAEIDQTALLAPFFMLFFGLCLGDAGYGLLILLGATYFKFKGKARQEASNPLLTLLQWLGGASALIGLALGGCFGVTLPYASRPDYILNQDNLMILSIILGLVQILFGKLVAAYKIKIQRGVKYALAPFAWVVFLLGIGAILLLPKLSLELPEWIHYVVYSIIGVSALLVFFYNTPGANPFSNLGVGLWNTYNVASGLLGDTLSYIRLFAIGLTGGTLGGVFNTLAIEQTEGLPAVARFPLMFIVLLLGHGLNIGLGVISSFVHPLRLTFVEYYKNSEFEGGGKPYSPLQ